MTPQAKKVYNLQLTQTRAGCGRTVVKSYGRAAAEQRSARPSKQLFRCFREIDLTVVRVVHSWFSYVVLRVVHKPNCDGTNCARFYCLKTNDVDKQLEELALADLRHIKVLLLGAGESGKSTVVKQASILFDNIWREHVVGLHVSRCRMFDNRSLYEYIFNFFAREKVSMMKLFL